METSISIDDEIVTPKGKYLTYKEWKQIPTRRRPAAATAKSKYLTYKEWKQVR